MDTAGPPKALLIDLDGVLYVGNDPVDGAAEAAHWIAQQRIPHLYVTNTTSRPRSALVERLAGFGIETDASDILTPPVAAVSWLGENAPGPVALFVPSATRPEFDALEILDDEANEGAAAVVIGDLGHAWDFATLNRAFRLLMCDPAPALVALGMTRYWRSADGLQLDVAPFVVALEHACGCKATVLGKPAEPFFATALRILDAPSEAVVMIGDDIVGDVGGAQSAGIRGVLVRTGKYRPKDLEGTIEPEAVLDSFAGLPAWWKAQA